MQRRESASEAAPIVGAQIGAKFKEFLLDMYDAPLITADISDDEINESLRCLEGDSLPGFPSPDTFEMLISPHMSKLVQPCLDILEEISLILQNVAQKLSLVVFQRFPELGEKVFEIATGIIDAEREKTKVILECVVNSATSYAFTNDDDYLIQHGAMAPAGSSNDQWFGGDGQQQMPDPNDPNNPVNASAGAQFQQNNPEVGGFYRMKKNVGNMAENIGNKIAGTETKHKIKYAESFIKDIRGRIEAYFRLVVRNLRDSVPKCIGFYLTHSFRTKLQFALNQEIQNEKILNHFLKEPPHIQEERTALKSQSKIVQEAHAVLSRDIEIQMGEVDYELER